MNSIHSTCSSNQCSHSCCAKGVCGSFYECNMLMTLTLLTALGCFVALLISTILRKYYFHRLIASLRSSIIIDDIGPQNSSSIDAYPKRKVILKHLKCDVPTFPTAYIHEGSTTNTLHPNNYEHQILPDNACLDYRKSDDFIRPAKVSIPRVDAMRFDAKSAIDSGIKCQNLDGLNVFHNESIDSKVAKSELVLKNPQVIITHKINPVHLRNANAEHTESTINSKKREFEQIIDDTLLNEAFNRHDTIYTNGEQNI